ncbi:putative cyclophilin type peptidyl-prolyl cis-trans isomerase/CLD [Lyophyllum shimeji]|uniref:Cyclophilin type peptidyl-prolyl cis-trans isomerase/CLD n=1 Tax=Lyophyllum shimeji TaxID=47721 RepID=A0A9P3UJW3_LYOSH|nr:putative cyclophilin type peptidyl-prolyl cis-trans isomerase/CLD [Lyophyllum shimeji]
MGHGNSDKLYITHAEHSGLFGSHSASSGFKAKAQAPHPGTRTPFDCCALTFQPFTHPVCARNKDGTGHVFDLVNIIPWLKQHNNTHPITKEPLTPDDLITLNYSRKEASGEIHDPISFKPFSEHSHIVAIATTGNVFLAESIKGGRDLVSDIPFKKQDVITLQNPHGLPPASVPVAAAASSSVKSKDDPAKDASARSAVSAVAAVKAKPAVPWNISPYSTGMPGASLTSTSVDPQTTSSKLLWDEEELMFEDISNPLKGKGKEKDVGKRRAYVRLVTSLGGGSLNLELYCEKAPKTCYNFLMLAKAGKYDECLFHRLVPGFMIQTGDPTGTGAGGESYWGTPFRDEHDLKGAAKHDSRGVLAMANKGPNTNGSQFYITFKPTPHLDKKHTVFGKLVGGENVLDLLEKLPLKAGTERPAKSVKITEVIIYQDPFDDYKKRLANKLAKRAQAKEGTEAKAVEKEADDINWFGVKVGTESVAAGSEQGGVGKYLNLKRPIGGSAISAGMDESKKKRKIGFGDFEGW